MNSEIPLFSALHIGAFAFFMSLAISGFTISAGLLDAPVARSSHKNPVPTAGGLGLVAGFATGLLAAALFYPSLGEHQKMGQIAALALGAAFLGLLDDIYVVGTRIKFFILLILALACVYVIGAPQALPFAAGQIALPLWLGALGSVMWIFVVVNTVNFMDGINGIMGGVMLTAFVFLALISVVLGAFTPAIVSIIMAGALAGFLPYNARQKAHIFCGDVGALLTGFVFAAASFMLVVEKEKYGILYVAPLLILPFLMDVLLTIIARAARKEKLLSPHRSHIYQRLVHSGRSHMFVTMLYIFSGILVGAIAIFGVVNGWIRSVFFLAIWVCVLSGVYLALNKALAPSEPGQPQTPPSP